MEYGHGDVGNGMSDPKPVDDNEFAEFMWMGEELDEFDQQVEQQLMEEFLIETCVEQMLRDDDDEETIPPDLTAALNVEMMRGPDGQPSHPGVKPQDAADLATRMADLNLASRSRLNPNAPVFTLNPNASVFVPRGPAPPAPAAAAPQPDTGSSCPEQKEAAEAAKSGDDKELRPEAKADSAATTPETTPQSEDQAPSNPSN